MTLVGENWCLSLKGTYRVNHAFSVVILISISCPEAAILLVSTKDHLTLGYPRGRKNLYSHGSRVFQSLEMKVYTEWITTKPEEGLPTSDIDIWHRTWQIGASDIRHRTSDIGHRISDIGHRTSNIRTSDTGHQTSNIRRQSSDISLQTSDIRHRTSDIRHRTSDIRHRTSDIRHQTSDIRHQTSDIRHETSDNWQRTSAIRLWTSDISHHWHQT